MDNKAKAKKGGLTPAEIVISFLVIGIVGLIIIPLPTSLLDIFIVTNLTIAINILLITLFTKSVLEFSTFPTVLLITTMFKLGLNMSSTRSILTTGNGGHVIEAFADVAARCEALQAQLPADRQTFFYDHLSAYAHYMAHLSRATHEFVYAYKNKTDDRFAHLSTAYEEMKAAKDALLQSQHDIFATWYATDDKFEMDARIEAIRSRMMEEEDLTLTEQLIENYDFERGSNCQVNPAGSISRGIPCGWTSVGQLKKGSNGLDSYGVNQDAKNLHGTNVCWMNSVPMPDYFELSQTIPAAKLTPGTYRVACKLWVESNKKTSCRLFASTFNPHPSILIHTWVQYYGTQADYTNLLTPGEEVSYAGYAGGNSGDITLRDMELYVTVGEGEDLSIGIKTGNRRNNGQVATDNAGWFKVDFFRIHKVDEPTKISSLPTSTRRGGTTSVYDLQGRKVEQRMNTDRHGNHQPSTIKPGIYIIGGNKVAVK